MGPSVTIKACKTLTPRLSVPWTVVGRTDLRKSLDFSMEVSAFTIDVTASAGGARVTQQQEKYSQ